MHAYMDFPLCLHLEEGACRLDYRFYLSKHMHPRISHSCRFAAWAHKVTHLRPGRRLCVPRECVFALRARGMSGQTDSFLRRLTALALEMTSPWRRQSMRGERFIVYYESIKREPKIRGINKCRCDERLQTKTKEFTRLPYTGLVESSSDVW